MIDFRARRVDQADQTDQAQSVIQVGQHRLGIRDLPPGKGQNPLTALCDPVRLGLPVVNIERRSPCCAQLVGAHFEQAFGGALDHDQLPAVGRLGQYRHVAMQRVEGYFVAADPAVIGVSGLCREGQERTFHGVAFDVPGVFLLMKRGIVAQEGGVCDFGKRTICLSAILAREVAPGRIAVASNGKPAFRRDGGRPPSFRCASAYRSCPCR